MKFLSIWLKAIRLKTLPLAAGGILLGSFLAAYEYSFSIKLFLLLLTTAVLLQILSNLANDYGDFKKGTDAQADRGDRMLVSGQITERSMKLSLILLASLSFLSGILLLFAAFSLREIKFYIWLSLGIAAIVAAFKYTIGKKAYGYSGWGDMAVFVFFGLLSVCGSYYFMTGRFTPNILVPSVSWGFLCVAVLNINNLRDIENDRIAGKITFAVLLGVKYARIYLYTITLLSFVLIILFSGLTVNSLDAYLPVMFIAPYYFIYKNLFSNNISHEKYNNALKQISLLNFAFVLLLGFIWIL